MARCSQGIEGRRGVLRAGSLGICCGRPWPVPTRKTETLAATTVLATPTWFGIDEDYHASAVLSPAHAQSTLWPKPSFQPSQGPSKQITEQATLQTHFWMCTLSPSPLHSFALSCGLFHPGALGLPSRKPERGREGDDSCQACRQEESRLRKIGGGFWLGRAKGQRNGGAGRAQQGSPRRLGDCC